MDNREIGARIRLARRDAGLTQEKLAEKIGVSTVFVSQLESGSRAPGLETLVKLSQTLHVSLDLLVLGGAPGGDAEAIGKGRTVPFAEHPAARHLAHAWDDEAHGVGEIDGEHADPLA